MEQRCQRNEIYAPGTGVVISDGVYRKLIGKILILDGTVKMLGDSSRIPRPFDVVHSGKTTIAESGFSLRRVERDTRRADGDGDNEGGSSARSIA